jgi:5-methylcytosine-specific restriction endonuclease McrA
MQSVETKNYSCPLCDNQLTIERTEHFRTEVCESCLEHWVITDIPCDHFESDLVKFIQSNGIAKARRQCCECHDFVGGDVGGYTKEQRESLPLANIELREKSSNNKWEFRRIFYERRKEITEERQRNKKTLWFRDYSNYLRSDKWKAKRLLVLKRDNYLCQACLNNTATDVHHKTYEFVMQEPLFDLVAVCKRCHDHIHSLKDAKKN